MHKGEQMKDLTRGIITSQLLRSTVIQAISTKKLGNMSYDREKIKGQAEKSLTNLLQLLNLDLALVSLAVLPTNNTCNVAIINQPSKKGRLILHSHSPEIKELYNFDGKNGFDACITKEKDTLLAILPADCAPVMLYDPITGYIALIHAGKKGVGNWIVCKTIHCLKNYCGVNTKNLYCYIGPTICRQCYKPDGLSFDLISAIIHQILLTGAQAKKIEISPFCTAHHSHLFFSNFRSKGSQKEGRQIAVLGKK
jgi:copper oxidase (laccase) domain-containing protein